jgi:Sec-independent protein translocase protein TatA
VFGLGLWEIGVVVLLAVMLFPPKELPKLARSIARTYGAIRRTAEEFRSQIMEDEDLRAPIDEVRSAYNDARWELKKAEAAARRELQRAEMEARKAAKLVKDEDDNKKADSEVEQEKPGEKAVAAAKLAAADDGYDESHRDPFKDEPKTDEGSPLEAFKEDEPEERPDRVPAKPPRAYVPPPPPVATPKNESEAEAKTDETAETSVA